MDARHRVVLVDAGIGLVSIAIGLVQAGDGIADLWWIGLLAGIATSAAAWGSEHGVLGVRTTILVVAAVGVVAFALGLGGFHELLVERIIPVSMIGLGVGLVAYRVCFGLVRPVPERRLERAREQTV